MFDSIDFKNCEVMFREDSEIQKEDLLLLKCPNDRLIDVGWYGQDNRYCIMVVQDYKWDSPCYCVCRQAELSYVEHHLQKIIDFETAVFEPSLQGLFDKVTAIIDADQPFSSMCDDAISILKQLRDKGIAQNEVANYIEVYAMKYLDSDERKWDFACDILDRVTGWCSPGLWIWKEGEKNDG